MMTRGKRKQADKLYEIKQYNLYLCMLYDINKRCKLYEIKKQYKLYVYFNCYTSRYFIYEIKKQYIFTMFLMDSKSNYS